MSELDNQNKTDITAEEGAQTAGISALDGTSQDGVNPHNKQIAEVQDGVRILCYAPQLTSKDAADSPKIPLSADKEWMEAKLQEIFDEVMYEQSAEQSTGEHKEFLTRALPESEKESEALLRSRAKYLIILFRFLNTHNMKEQAEKLKNVYFTGELKDKILFEIANKSYDTLAVNHENPFSYEDVMQKGDDTEKAREAAVNKDGLTGTNYYLWAAGIAANHEQDPEKFEAALIKAAEAGSKCFNREYQGAELALLAVNAKQVFDDIIPLVKENIARQ